MGGKSSSPQAKIFQDLGIEMQNVFYKNAFQYLKSLKFSACGELFSCLFSFTKCISEAEFLKKFRLRRATYVTKINNFATHTTHPSFCEWQKRLLRLVKIPRGAPARFAKRFPQWQKRLPVIVKQNNYINAGPKTFSQMVEVPTCIRKNDFKYALARTAKRLDTCQQRVSVQNDLE